MSVSPLDYLRHILDEAKYLMDRMEGLSKNAFLHDETLKRAFVRSIEIIGEAAKRVSVELKEKYPQLQWRAMAGMRDKLVHDYLGIDYDIALPQGSWTPGKGSGGLLEVGGAEVAQR